MFNYCQDLIRRLDYEGYLIANIVSKKLKWNLRTLDAVMAVKAYDAEIASISHASKSPEAAALRYEFWKTALNRIKTKQSVEGHPVLEDLVKAGLNQAQMYWLEGCLKARADSLDRRIVSFNDLDDYSQRSLVPILWCIHSIIDASRTTPDSHAEHALSHLGKAQVTIRRLKGLARALHLQNPTAEQFVPIGLLGSSGLNGPKLLEVVKSGENLDQLKDLVYEMATHAHSHLNLIKEDNANLFTKLSKYSAMRYLATLEKNNFSLLNSKVMLLGSRRDGFLPILLYFNSLFSIK